MRKRRLYLLVTLFVVVTVVGIFVRGAFSDREPEYGDKRLSAWVKELPENASYTGKSQAEEAIRRMGTNAIPHLLKWIRWEPSGLMLKLRPPANQILRKFNPAWKLSEEKYLRADGAIRAFMTLGPEAKVAIGELSALLNDPK